MLNYNDSLDLIFVMREDADIAFSENYKILRIMNEADLNAYAEGIFSKITDAAANAAAGAAKASGKATMKSAANTAKWAGSKVEGAVDNHLLKGNIGQSIKLEKERLKKMFKTMVQMVIKMLNNIVQAVFGAEKRLSSVEKNIADALAKRKPSVNPPKFGNVLNVKALQDLGFDSNIEGSRGNIVVTYVSEFKNKSLLEGVTLGDEPSVKKSIGIILSRVTGKESNYDSISPEEFGKLLKEELSVFASGNKQVNKKNMAFGKALKDPFLQVFGKQGASVNSSSLNPMREKVSGDQVAPICKESLELIRTQIGIYLNLKVSDYLKKEMDYVNKSQKEIDSLLEKTIREEQNVQQAQQTVNNTQQQNTQENNQQGTTEKADAQSYIDVKLLRELRKAGYSEAILTEEAKETNNTANIEDTGKMRKEHAMVQTFLQAYSQSLNETLQAISQFYNALAAAGKDILSTYIKVTE